MNQVPKSHNQLLQEFHVALTQDPCFMEVLQVQKGADGKPLQSTVARFVEAVLRDPPSGPKLQQEIIDGAGTWEETLDDHLNVHQMEWWLAACSKDGLSQSLEQMRPLLEAAGVCLRDQDHMRVVHALEVFCVILRAIRSKRLELATFLSALGGESQGEQFLQVTISDTCRILNSERGTNFARTLALKLLNIFCTTFFGDQGQRILQWVREEGALQGLSSTMCRSRHFRHCLSLDGSVLCLAIGLVPLQVKGGPDWVGSLLDDLTHMKAMLEGSAVLGEVGNQRLLTAKFRKTSFLEGLLLQKPAVPVDPKASRELLQEGGEIQGGQLCYIMSYSLSLYYVCTRHSKAVISAYAANSDPSGEHVDAAATSTGELIPSGIDGHPSIYPVTITYLSLLLDNPAGETALHAQLVLLSFLPLVEDPDFLAAVCKPNSYQYLVFSREAESEAGSGLAKQPANLPSIAALANVIIEFLSSNLKMALEASLYLVGFKILHRLLCYHKNWCTGGEDLPLDWKKMVPVALRVLTYLSRPAVWKAVGAEAMELACMVASVLNLLVVHGATMLPGEESYAFLCYEIARVGSAPNKVFEKFGSNLTSPSPEPTEASLVDELKLLHHVAEHVNAAVETWLEESKIPSPSSEEILSLVAQAAGSLSLPVRQDLLNFENFCETDAELSLARGRAGILLDLYCRYIHVFPPPQ